MSFKSKIACRMKFALALVDEDGRTQEVYFQSFDQGEVEAQKEQYSKQQDCTECGLKVKCLIKETCLKLEVLSFWSVAEE